MNDFSFSVDYYIFYKEMMPDDNISVFACATSKTAQVQNFIKSFDCHTGWDVHIVGMGLKWETFRTKMKCYRDALRKVNKKQVVVCLDAYDAFCIRDSDGFLSTFYKYETPILISYEPLCAFTVYNRFFQFGCCPNIDKWKKFHQVSLSEPIYVNSGCIVGYAGEMYKMFDWILGFKGFSIQDDQVGVGMYMNEFPHNVQLDLEDRFVFNDNFSQRLQINVSHDNQIQMNLRHKPYFLHFPGIKYMPRTTHYETICSALLGEQVPLHETVHIPYFQTTVVIVVVLLVLFLIHRKK
jgi:hypothetical protein